MKLSDFDYELPPELIAQYPIQRRDQSRLILLHRRQKEVRETRFSNFVRYLYPGDLLLVNESKVIPARFFGSKSTKARIEILLVARVEPGKWRALCRPSRRVHPGNRIYIGEEREQVEVVEEMGGGEWLISLPPGMREEDFLLKYGQVPLPPYIRREAEKIDGERYQTVYAQREGSVAAPTAGLHFTAEMLRRIENKGCTVMPLTLHVGPGTFRPLEEEVVENNVLPSEFIMLKSDYWDAIREAKASGRRIIAVGTTTTRALEALALSRLEEHKIRRFEGEEYITGWTDLFIYPGFEFKIVDALVTNLHLPRSSLLTMVSAFAGREEILKTYQWAVARKFRFYSYGDVMFIK
ncbi:MAG: tRNA preQ1(34) S-adenosylmethionine ribosyltransferase-isomerase QueA [Candidatus Krumholzibacteriota bacterium]|nr:tRNA preQ1(34) S-adenosylmethionine ribosyltransferase-isomerase QueA [Candidatus Krumholzibacteriota bacterium]